MTDINQTYGDHFPMYTNNEALYYTPDTNILNVNYTSIKKEKEKKELN